MRERLNDRRPLITQEATIGGQKVYAQFGEYADGRLAELFIVANKTGTFLRGVLDTLARTASLALQFGAPPEEVAKLWRNLNFPPNGAVEGSGATTAASSLADWLAQEIEAYYVKPVAVASAAVSPPAEAPPALPSKVAGAITSGSGV